MKNKYYTPTLEEFHVGFEYETMMYSIQDSTLPKGISKEDYFSLKFSERIKKYPNVRATKMWIKTLFSETSSLTDFCSLEYEYGKITNISIPDTIRVKHLDKEDIESCGFYLIHDGWYHQYPNYNKDGLQIIVRDKYIGISFGVHEYSNTLFKGTIKNKSEFKRILKQIGI